MSFAQPWNNLRQKKIVLHQDTTIIDTLSIVPGSVVVSNSNGTIDSSEFAINFEKGFIVNKSRRGKENLFNDSINIYYRVFPYSFSEEIYHKDKRKIGVAENGIINPFIINYENETPEIFKFGGLNRSGSISRGISFGNNQDVVVNSSLNLQMSGKISDNIDVLAAITDENIPFQPEGNTQQLQEFDKVFIQLSNNNSKLIAGDYELRKPDSHFMNFYKKAQGGSFTTSFVTAEDENEKPLSVMRTGLSVAVSKGKFGKNSFDGTEGNQGPYKLVGANNEVFIVVLSGSEKVYINGALLIRGQQNDYVIDYNNAQITFTASRAITKDARIVVEFQYSDKNYLRSLVYFNNEFDSKKWKLKFNFFSEQDSKNQPLQQELSNGQKKVLKEIGDSLDQAIVMNVDTVAFNPNQILYQKTDSLDIVNSILYHNIYIYSINADSAIYRVGFSFVGQGKGNYLPANTAANGKVYQWIMPVNGVPQGAYEPITILVTPKLQQLYTFSADYLASKNTVITTETGLSNYDANTFSSIDKKDNVGLAERIGVINSIPLDFDSSGWKLNSKVDYEFVEKTFKPIERFRSVEFERDWNLGSKQLSEEEEHIIGLTSGVSRIKNGNAQYHFKKYIRGNVYDAYSNGVSSDFRVRKFRLLSDGSLMNSQSDKQNSRFLRHKIDFSKGLKYFAPGIKEDQEDNRFYNKSNDTLQKGSYHYDSWEVYIQNSDSAINRFRIFYGKRYDHFLKSNDLVQASNSENTGISLALQKNPDHHVTFNSTFRRLNVQDTTITTEKSGDFLLSNVDHYISLLNGGLSYSTYYEIGTGQELKKEFAYLEVPAGQGNYAWVDYNGNGVKELNEFEIANSTDQAKYVKVLVPTNEFVRTNSNQFTEVFNLNPAAAMEDPHGFKKFVSRLSNQFLFRKERKTSETGIVNLINPFVSDISDSALVALHSSIQNTFYFNRSSSHFGFDVGVLENRSKSLLTNGFESNSLTEQTNNIRWNMTRVHGVTFSYKSGEKTNSSQFFSSRVYRILFNRTEPKYIIQTSTSFRIVFSYEYTHKLNVQDTIGERANQHKAGTEVKYSTPKQGTLIVHLNYIKINFNAADNSPIAYEMLEGFKKGENYSWGLSLQRTLASGLQLSINYEGRKPASTPVIHTGGVQLRAYF